MAPSHSISALPRALVRIPGNGSDASARPLCLNLARTLTNTDGPLGPLVRECLANGQETVRPIVPLMSENQETRQSRPGEEETTSKSPEEVPQEKNRSEETGEAERKCTSSTDSPNGSPAAVRKYLDVRVTGGDRSTTGEVISSSLELSGGDGSVTSGPRPTLKPMSTISRLAEAVQELQKKQRDSENERIQLQEEVELLNKKVATFREIFQDTHKLKAVLRRLNITL